jgi:hypothetical protein
VYKTLAGKCMNEQPGGLIDQLINSLIEYYLKFWIHLLGFSKNIFEIMCSFFPNKNEFLDFNFLNKKLIN